jgi:hypothetical protein
MPPKRVVYLFGAGATIGEWQFAAGETGEKLSLRSISESAITKAKEVKDFQGMLLDVPPDDIKDIELYISLLESIHTKKYSDLASLLRSLFCKSVQDNLLYNGKPITPNLTMALLEMHMAICEDEILTGAISLNYDNLLDRAFNEVHGGLNYGIKCKCEKANYAINDKKPLLIKLHGSFNWKKGFHSIHIDEEQAESAEQAEMLWIPPSIEKERDTYPYNLLWGKASEILDCEILRIIGCKLSQNDLGLISLLFNTQLESVGVYNIELINDHQSGMDIRERNGFLKNVFILGELENCKDLIDSPPVNTYESWLRSKLAIHRGRGVEFDKYPHINLLMGEIRK